MIFFTTSLSVPAAKVTVASQYIRHADFYANKGDVDENDIALIRFQGGLPAGYAPAPLLGADETDVLENGAEVTLAGFGRTIGDESQLKKGEDDGSGVLRKVQTTIRDAHHGNTEVIVEQSDGKGACHGDSGGPAFVRGHDGTLKLFGVTEAAAPRTCWTPARTPGSTRASRPKSSSSMTPRSPCATQGRLTAWLPWPRLSERPPGAGSPLTAPPKPHDCGERVLTIICWIDRATQGQRMGPEHGVLDPRFF